MPNCWINRKSKLYRVYKPSNNIVANHNRYGYVFSNYKTMPIFKNKINSLLIKSTMSTSKK